MNLLGRILVVGLFLLSIIFMTLAMTVYATHRNWKNVADTAKKQLADARTESQALQRRFNTLQSQLEAEKESALQQVRKLETEAVRLAEANSSIQLRLNELSGQQREAVQSVNATQEANNQLASEVSRLRDSISENIQERDKSFAVALRATETLQSLRNELEDARERAAQLSSETGRMSRLLESNGVDPLTPVDGITPRVDGFVSGTKRRNGVQLVEISIGGDDGLRVGDTVEVFRDTKYKGRLEILKTAPDRAVGRVDVRFQEGPILEGDRVATRLNLG